MADGNVSASTQTQVLSAVPFPRKSVLEVDPGWIEDLPRPKRPMRVPAVLTAGEVRQVLDAMTGAPKLVAYVLCGTGLRLLEALQLRVQDVDFVRGEITVRHRRALLPGAVRTELAEHLARWRTGHADDAARDGGWVALPDPLDRKYPAAGREWAWQWVFPATRTYRDPATGAAVTTCMRPWSSAPYGRPLARRNREAGVSAHAAPLVRDAPPAGRLRHPHRAGPPRSPRHEHRDDPHARPEP